MVLTGQAIVTYEVFTGKALPRRGLLRFWQRALILAAGYSLLVGFSATLQIASIYSLLVSTALLVLFYALLSWRSYAEREHFIDLLRPFITSQQLYDQLLETPDHKPAPGSRAAFPGVVQPGAGRQPGDVDPARAAGDAVRPERWLTPIQNLRRRSR